MRAHETLPLLGAVYYVILVSVPYFISFFCGLGGITLKNIHEHFLHFLFQLFQQMSSIVFQDMEAGKS